MSRTITHRPPIWKSMPLYMFLSDIFPDHRTPFNRLDVDRIAREVEKNYESLYRWLRESRLNVEWAKLLCDLANTPENVARLAAADRQPPTLEQDFVRFIF